MSPELQKKSKVVFIRRLAWSLPESMAITDAKKEPEVKAYFDNAFRAIGSYWPKGSMRPGTGLTLTEENLLMPYVLDIPKDDRDFRKQSTDFFHAISIKVDPVDTNGEGGTKLEIGLNDNTKDMGENNLPVNISDYVKYRFVISHPEVAMSASEGKGNRLKKYFIHNPADVIKGNLKAADIKDEAYAAYLEIKEKAPVVNQYLTLLNENPRNWIGQETVKLREFVELEPGKFMAIHNDKSKGAKYMISNLLSAGVLEQVGTRYLFKEGGAQLGSNMQDAIAYLKDEANSRQVVIFKQLIQDWQKKEKGATTLTDVE